MAPLKKNSMTKGKVRQTKRYTPEMIDWIAVYDRTTDRCYYLSSSELGLTGRSDLTLRFTPARNGQHIGIRPASEYLEPDFSHAPGEVEPAGLEPAPFALQTRRSSN